MAQVWEKRRFHLASLMKRVTSEFYSTSSFIISPRELSASWPPTFLISQPSCTVASRMCLPQNSHSFSSSPRAGANKAKLKPWASIPQALACENAASQRGERTRPSGCPSTCMPTPLAPHLNDVIATLRANLKLINFLDICIDHECMQAVFIS